MRQKSFAEMHCSLARSLEVVGDWWTPLVLRDLFLGLDRFEQLVADLGISRNLLTDRLDTLVAGGVVAREQYQDNPPRSRYVLTGAGRELVPVLLALTAWGDRWLSGGEPPVLVHHEACGATATAVVCCSGCGGALSADEVSVSPGPGARPGPGTALLGTVLRPRTT
ncbi:helix-turn-helix domain-containing protein [Kineococcus sp. NUM-3379]